MKADYYAITPAITSGLACGNCESKDREIERLRDVIDSYVHRLIELTTDNAKLRLSAMQGLATRESLME